VRKGGQPVAASVRIAWHSGPVETNYFDARIAANYDGDSTDMFDSSVVGSTVDFLADLARGGTAQSASHVSVWERPAA
jgi:hypothetical protein